MKFVTTLLALALTTGALAQTDSAQSAVYAPAYSSLYTLTKTEIERLPAENFLDLVQGAFPFVGNVSVIEEEYAFLVDGFIAVHPNSINLSQIETVRYFPAGTLFTRGSLGKKGTFVIHTKPLKNDISVSTKTGVLLRSPDPGASLDADLGTGVFSFNELGYRRRTEQSFVTAAVSYLGVKNPTHQVATPTVQQHLRSTFNRTRASAFAGYKVSRQLMLEGGLFYTAQTQKSDYSLAYQPGLSTQMVNVNQLATYTGAHLALQFSSAVFSNRFMAEISATDDEKDEYAETVLQTIDKTQRTTAADGSPFVYAFTNQFVWQTAPSAAWTLQTVLTARYRETKVDEKSRTESRSSQGQLSASGWMTAVNSRSFSLSPTVVLQHKNIVSAEAGATYDSYGISDKGPNENKKILPHGGLKVELAPLLGRTGIGSLELSSVYSQYYTSFDRADRLETDYRTTSVGGGISFFPNPDLRNYYTSTNWLTSLGISFWKNRMALKLGYRKHDRMIRAYSQGAWGMPSVLLQEPLKAKSWSAEIKATLLDKPDLSWTVYATAFHDRYERKTYGNSGFVYYSIPYEQLYLDAGKTPWRGGLRTAVNVKRLYLQAAALFAFNENAENNSGVLVDDVNNFRTNFFLVGYKWSLRAGIVKGLEANLQSRNLLNSRNFLFTRYIGAGIHVQF